MTNSRFFPLSFLIALASVSPGLWAQTGQDSTSSQSATSASSRSQQQVTSCGPAGCIVSHDDTPLPTAQDVPTRSNLEPSDQEQHPSAMRPGQSRTTHELPRNPLRDERESDRSALMPPEPLSDFERFVQDTTGTAVPVFGQNLFQNTTSDFIPATNVAPPADYVLGPGDQIKVRTWGNVQMDISATVDRGGQIFLPQVGSLNVAGLRADQLHDVIRTSISRVFRTFELSVTLGQLRSIQVFVLGYARRPGVYTISSLSTLVNALFESGGPSRAGSLRDIQLKRGGTILTHFDVYDLLLNGDKTKDMHLLPGDVIVIPLVGPQMATVGNVTQPAIYELKGTTTADEALRLAGGLTPVAGIQRASLDRIVDHSRRTVEDFPLNGPQRLIPVQGGDILRVFPISSKIDQAVTLRGFVGQPGRYPWHAGMRVSDLIPNREFLLPRNYYNTQNAPKNLAVDPFAADATKPEGARTRALTGAQREAIVGAPELLDQGQQPDLASHDTEINWNYAAIERLGTTDLTTHIVSFALGDAVDHPASPEDKTLEPGDVLVVYSVRDINLPTELRARFVRVDGEVARPGIYRMEGDQTLRDLVQRAGGLAPHAYPYAAQLSRESVRVAEEIKLHGLIQRETQEVFSPVNTTTSADARGSTNDLELRRAYLQALQQVRATGRVVLQMSPTTQLAADLPAFTLQDGDHFFVPAVPNTVEVLGNVFNQGSLRYVTGKHVGEYLNAAGGHTREADKSHDFVLRADGSVLSRERTARFDKLLLYPGDAVVVPGRFKPGFNLYEALSVAQMTSSLAIAAAAVSALH